MRKKIFAVMLTITMLASTLDVAAADINSSTSSENAEQETVSESSIVGETSVTEMSYMTYPDAVSSNYTLISKTGGAYQSGTWMYVIPGKTISFEIGDKSGEKIKGAKKSATWSISGNSSFSVNNGKLKLEKKASVLGPGVSGNDISKAVLVAEYNGETIWLGLVGIVKTKYMGYLEDAKLKNTASVTGKVGASFDLRNLNSMIGKSVIASYKVEKNGINRNYLYFAGLEELGPGISAPDKAIKNAEVTYDETGSLVKFKPIAEGKYKITYKLRDGSGKSFKLTLIAES